MRALLLILFLAIPAWSTDYYVSTTGDDDGGANDCTDINDPCATGDRAFDQINSDDGSGAGDTLHICIAACDGSGSGTYDYQWSGISFQSGASGDPFTIRPYSGESVTLGATTCGGNLINLSGNFDWMHWRDFTMLDGTGCNNVIAFRSGADNNIFENMDVQGDNTGGNSCIIGSVTGSPTTADNNTFIDLAVHDCGNSTGDHGFYILNNGWVLDGVDVYGSITGYGIHFFCQETGCGITGGTVKNSKIHDTTGTGGILVTNGFDANGDGGIEIYNNWLYDNSSTDLIFGLGSSFGCQDCLGVNNTTDGSIITNNSSEATTVTVQCNIRATYTDNEGGNTETDGIAFSAVTLVSKTGGSEDFHLVSGDTAAIDLCDPNSSGTFTDDFDGDTRPDGSAWDIGSDEFISASSGIPAFIHHYRGLRQ